MPEKDAGGEIARSEQAWLDKNAQRFKGESKREFISTDGISIKRVYTPQDLQAANFDYLKDMGFPGEYPYTRGIDPSMYRDRSYFKVRQTAGLSSAEESNKMFKRLLAAGNSGLSVETHLPTKLGYDSDDPTIRGDVGKVGVAIDSLKDMEILFDGIDVTRVRTALLNVCCLGVMLGTMFLLAAEKRGIPRAKASAFTQLDIWAGYTYGLYAFSPAQGLRLTTDWAVYVLQHAPRFAPYYISEYAFGEAGANRIQQIAFSFSGVKALIRAALKRGVAPDAILPTIDFLAHGSHRDLLAEVAKQRAARRLWARICKEEFGAAKPESCQYRFRVGQAGSELTVDVKECNIARIALATLGMALSGAQIVGGPTWDEPLGIPPEKTLIDTIRNRYLVIDETGIGDTVDALGGSYYVESLTSRMEAEITKEMARIEQMGGMEEAVKSGYIQQKMAQNAYQHQKSIETGEEVVMGLNKYPEEVTWGRKDRYEPESDIVEKQAARLKALKSERDNARVQKALDAIRRTAEMAEGNDNNLTIPIFEAIKEYATVGEVRSALQDVWGRYRLPTVF